MNSPPLISRVQLFSHILLDVRLSCNKCLFGLLNSHADSHQIIRNKFPKKLINSAMVSLPA